ncbi:MAG TPA: DUF3006 domain-containing protein [Gemmatimonadales bacterium]|nr:DUF3006 domain-containing protein [Gemmatimonadales bacterium]
MNESRHIWTVDAIEDDSAAIEVDGRQVTTIPRWMLPTAAMQGDVLAVRHHRGAARSSITIELDEEATRAAYEESAGQVETMRRLMEERRARDAKVDPPTGG